MYTRRADLSVCLIADKEYPSRVAFAVLGEVADKFLQAIGSDASKWLPTSEMVQSWSTSTLKPLMAKY